MLQALKDTFSRSNVFQGMMTAAAATGCAGHMNDEIAPKPSAAIVRQLSEKYIVGDNPLPPIFNAPENLQARNPVTLAQPIFEPSIEEKKEILTSSKYLSSLAERSGIDADGKPTNDPEKINSTKPSLMLENLIKDLESGALAEGKSAEAKARLEKLEEKAKKTQEAGKSFGDVVQDLKDYFAEEANQALFNSSTKKAFLETFDLLKSQALRKFEAGPAVTDHLKKEMNTALENFQKKVLETKDHAELKDMTDELIALLADGIGTFDATLVNGTNAETGKIIIDTAMNGEILIYLGVPSPYDIGEPVPQTEGLDIELGPEGEVPQGDKALPIFEPMQAAPKLPEGYDLFFDAERGIIIPPNPDATIPNTLKNRSKPQKAVPEA